MRHGMRQSSQRLFREPPISVVLRKAKLRPLTVAATTVKHTRIIFHAIIDVHAACHAARAHVEAARGRSLP